MDQCTHCTLRGDFENCAKTECSWHELWMVGQLRSEIVRLGGDPERLGLKSEWQKVVGALERIVSCECKTSLYCDNHPDALCVICIAKNALRDVEDRT